MPPRRTPSTPRRRPHGEGSITPTASGRWQVRVRDGGRQVRLTGGPWETEQAAREALIRWQAQRLDGHTARRQLAETTLRTVYLRSIEDRADGLATSSDRRTFYRGVITGEAEVDGRMILGDLPVGEITIETVEAWARAARQTGLKPATVQKWSRHLSQCLAWGVARGYLATNPVDGAIVVPRGAVSATRPPRRFLTLREMVSLTCAAADHVGPYSVRGQHLYLVETLLWSGLRQGEARALTSESLIHRPGAMLAVRHSVSEQAGGAPVLGPTKTRGSRRRVAIPVGLMGLIHNDLVLGGGLAVDAPLFPRESDPAEWMRGDALNHSFGEIRSAAGLTGDPAARAVGRRRAVAPHDLRATGASLLAQAGAGVPEVQAWLGHATPDMTLRLYTEVEEAGAEDPILTALRREGLTVAEILTRAYQEAWVTYGPEHGDTGASLAAARA